MIVIITGGWPIAMHTGSMVDYPSKVPFYWANHVITTGQPAFLATAAAKAVRKHNLDDHTGRRMTGGLELCLETNQGIRDIPISASAFCQNDKNGLLLPMQHTTVLPLSTEMTFLQDNIPFDHRFSSLLDTLTANEVSLSASNPDISSEVQSLLSTTWPSVNDMMKILRKMVSFSLTEVNTKNFGSYYAGSTPFVRYSGQLAEVENLCTQSIALTIVAMRFRAFCVQLEKAEVDGSEEKVIQILDYLLRHMSTLCHFASKDPVTTVSSIFDAGSEKGAQLGMYIWLHTYIHIYIHMIIVILYNYTHSCIQIYMLIYTGAYPSTRRCP